MAAPPVISAPGAHNANSYVSLEEADEYFAGRLFSEAWPAASISTNDIRAQAAITATKRVDQKYFLGEKTSETQALTWPLSGVPDPDRPGYDIDPSIIPTRVKEATFEVMIKLLSGGADPAQPDPLSAFSELGLPGGIKLKMRDGIEAPDALPSVAERLLEPLYLNSYDDEVITYLDRV